jgi:propionyl-CoA carboxylase beta chain
MSELSATLALTGAKVLAFREQFANPHVDVECGYVNAVIRPRNTLRRMIAAFETLDGKRDKNLPPHTHGEQVFE